MRRLSLALAVFATAHAAPSAPAPSAFDAQLTAARRTEAQLARKLDDGETTLRSRIRTLYKLTASGDLPFWVDETARGTALATRGAARRVILRDLEERRILRAEHSAAQADVARLHADAARAAFTAAQAPRDGSFLRPVEGDVVASFGSYNDERTHARLVRRGVELHARSPEVIAAAAGQVRWVGPLRSLGIVVIVDHGQGLVSVTSGLAEAAVHAGDLVAAGEPVGRAASSRAMARPVPRPVPRIGFEVRRGGIPVDPFPLLGARR